MHKMIQGQMRARLRLGPSALMAVVLLTAFAALVTIFLVLSHQALTLAQDEIRTERQVIAEMTARNIDGFLVQAAARLDQAAIALATRTPPDSPQAQRLINELLSRNSFFFLGIRLHDAEGRLTMSTPSAGSRSGDADRDQRHVSYVQRFHRKGVSEPFVDGNTGTVAVEISVPVQGGDGQLIGVLSGVTDLSSTNITTSLSQARDLGETGHADLIDIHGSALASTEEGPPLRPGDHIEFYRRMGLLRVPTVEVVPHDTGGPAGESPERHVMAYAPLLEADWGVAVGGDEGETFTPVRRLRTRIYAVGGSAAAALLVASLVAGTLITRKGG